MNHRDANQGTCTNSCRWEYDIKQNKESLAGLEQSQTILSSDGNYLSPGDGYYVEEKERTGEEYPMEEDENGTYLFNAKDLCAVELLDDIREAGVMSFKIEGRTKSEYYAAMATRSYRKAIDDMANGNSFDLNNLNDLTALSNRGYTTGFYARNPKEYGENYHDNRSLERSHKAVGMNCQWDQANGLLWFEVKNRLEVGTEIELFNPEEQGTVHISKLINEKEKYVDVVHGGGGRAAFPLEKDPGPFAVLRRPLYQKELDLLTR
jgi:putative protease